MMGAFGMGPMMGMMGGMGGMGKGMGKMGKGTSPMGQMGGKSMGKGNMVWQPQFMKKDMGPMGMGMGKGMM